MVMEESSYEFFHDFLTIGTLGSQTLRTDPPIPTIPMPIEHIERGIAQSLVSMVECPLQKYLFGSQFELQDTEIWNTFHEEDAEERPAKSKGSTAPNVDVMESVSSKSKLPQIGPKNVSEASSSSRIKDEKNPLKNEIRMFPERLVTLEQMVQPDIKHFL
ncbi:hypothetical protein HAX54_024026 [Datura stramonium]|uniref:Uncharacterized protein n=1 Tax=Datura stramonium TaxID=4076 RepID=A0ABS8S541_DATST|nr:hypothetical protein [Datura stramonium]